MKEVLVIIPAYNEESRIERVLTKYCSHFPNWEIIVVCDGVDNSPNIVRKLCEKYVSPPN